MRGIVGPTAAGKKVGVTSGQDGVPFMWARADADIMAEPLPGDRPLPISSMAVIQNT